jgi:antitoxin HicB
MVRYPVVLEPDDNGTVLVTFPDGYIRARRALPLPSHISGPAAELSPLMSTKVELYNAMQRLGVTKSILGRRLHWHPPQVDRLLNLMHSSQVDQLDAAAKALGGTLTIRIDGLPQPARTVYGPQRRRRKVGRKKKSRPVRAARRAISK